MDTRTKRRIRTQHAVRLGRAALAGYAKGRRRVVARALDISPTRLSHLTTDDVHPTLRASFDLLMDVAAVDEGTAQAFLEAVQAAVEARSLLESDVDTLRRRRAFLRLHEVDLERDENRAALTGEDYPRALRREAWAQLELAAIEEILEAVARGERRRDPNPNRR